MPSLNLRVLKCSTFLSQIGQNPMAISSSPSIESLPGGRGQSTASPPLPLSRGSDVSTSSPPPSATKKDSFFNITRSRSHSKTMGRKETVSCLTSLQFPLESLLLILLLCVETCPPSRTRTLKPRYRFFKAKLMILRP